MISVVFSEERDGITWIDIVEPTLEELQQIASDYDLHYTSLEDCLDPQHQPKYEALGDHEFLMMRLFDERDPEADTIQGMTSKVSIFCNEKFLLTIHRPDLTFMRNVQIRWSKVNGKDTYLILYDIVKMAILSYATFIESITNQLDDLEKIIFRNQDNLDVAEDLYLLRSRVSVIWRVLWQANEALGKWHEESSIHAPFYQDIKERIERYHSLLGGFREMGNNLFNTYLSLSTHRTNEIMRVLTLFSVFFMPLTFLTGMFGMNFKYFPEIEWAYGYTYFWSLVVGISGSLYFWFKRKGWL